LLILFNNLFAPRFLDLSLDPVISHQITTTTHAARTRAAHGVHLSLLASMLIDKYGERAPAATAHRVRLWTDADDRNCRPLARSRRGRCPRHEPTLPEVLDGAVTRATMDADRVSRKDVEAMMSGAAKKRRRTARRRHTNGRRHTKRRSSRRT
jgi:hypothetical protein